ncbi:MAG: hypothetical protein M3680_00385 [Myxococcota bacterium]|nr:hypothetical protein [Myxococcota bacterium]
MSRRPDVVTVLDPDNNTIGADASEYQGARPVVSNRTRYRSSYRPFADRGWTALTEPTRIDAGRQFINLGANLGTFDQLRLHQTAGESTITQVAIKFADGQTQVVRVGQRLNHWNADITIDLDGNARRIEGVVVYGATAEGSSYQLLAL